jgi:pimeloyl-ACP methyl ester carboxylesterase
LKSTACAQACNIVKGVKLSIPRVLARDNISLFRLPGGVAESLFQADDYQRLRAVYQGKLSDSAVSENIRRLAQPGALTSVLSWYRALNLEARIGKINVPALYIWGSQDLALGETAAIETARYVSGPYHFKKLEGRSGACQRP